MTAERTAARLDGKLVAAELIDGLRGQVRSLPYLPKLTFVSVGDDPASASYVRSKARLAERAGIESSSYELEEDVGQEELLALLARLNADESVDGILVQLPLPPGLDTRR